MHAEAKASHTPVPVKLPLLTRAFCFAHCTPLDNPCICCTSQAIGSESTHILFSMRWFLNHTDIMSAAEIVVPVRTQLDFKPLSSEIQIPADPERLPGVEHSPSSMFCLRRPWCWYQITGGEGTQARSSPPHMVCRVLPAKSILSYCNSCQVERSYLHHLLVSLPALSPNEVRVTAAISHSPLPRRAGQNARPF